MLHCVVQFGGEPKCNSYPKVNLTSSYLDCMLCDCMYHDVPRYLGQGVEKRSGIPYDKVKGRGFQGKQGVEAVPFLIISWGTALYQASSYYQTSEFNMLLEVMLAT